MSTDLRKPPARSTAEERREQLLRIARKIIETEGVEALRPTRVAELAGCTRPLIYQYFPSREDIFIAITEELYQVLEAESEAQNVGVIPAVAQGNSDPIRAVVEALWAHLDRHGPAALILRSTPEISVDFRRYLERLRDSYDTRWRRGFLDMGLDEAQADLALEVLFKGSKVIALQHFEGRFDRAEAIDRTIGMIAGLLAGVAASSNPSS